jgi:membrane-bound metal-dependent hydrolase YbcI (DUF457 family)
MFIGHFAVALAAKREAPRASLGWLLAAAQLPDLLWPVFLLLGWEEVRVAPGDTAFTPLAFTHYPWSHSLVADAVWGALLGALYFSRSRDRRGALVVAALVLSHWILDFVTHRADLPLAPGGGPRVGLGLWNSVVATLGVELLLSVVAVAVYLRATRARDRTGRLALSVLVATLLVIYVGNVFGPPPPGVTAIALVTLSMWLLVAWGGWVDAHRAPLESQRE